MSVWLRCTNSTKRTNENTIQFILVQLR